MRSGNTVRYGSVAASRQGQQSANSGRPNEPLNGAIMASIESDMA
jgi:hypothetical protein